MSFSADWLQLRVAADSRSRAPHLEAALRDALSSYDPTGTGRIIDLGSGSGANCRHLAPLLDRSREWLLIDNDIALLAEATRLCRQLPAVAALQTQRCDLARQLGMLPLATAALVTGSALLDLVSQDWLEKLTLACQQAQVPALFTLSYDGRIQLLPGDTDDRLLIEAVNEHQRSDKGFGAALGPAASAQAARLFRAGGYEVHSAPSDWLLAASRSDDAALLQPLITGWAEAASEQRPEREPLFAQWCARRLRAVADGTLQVRVGHEDVLALPGSAGSRSAQS
jgi:hypothetical protein